MNLPKKPKNADASKTHFTVGNLLLLKKAIRKLKGEGKYQIRFPIMDWAEEDLEIEVHCDAGQILTKTGSRDQIGIFGFIRAKITEQDKNQQFHKGIAISRPSSKSPRAATPSYAGEIQALFYGFDTARFIKEMLSELLFGNVGCSINTYVRNDNSDAVYHVDSMNTVTREND